MIQLSCYSFILLIGVDSKAGAYFHKRQLASFKEKQNKTKDYLNKQQKMNNNYCCQIIAIYC